MASIINLPDVQVSIVNASVEVQNTAQRVLFVGQKMPDGSAIALGLVQTILNDNSENQLFGEDSQLAAMIRAAKKENKVTIFDVIPLDDDGSAVDATGTIVIAGGPATEAGTLEVIIGSELNHKFSIPVASGDSITDIGDTIEEAINADSKVPVVALNSVGTVTLTAVNGGTLGNDIGLVISGTVAGVTHSVTAMTGGAVDPDLSTVFVAAAEQRYQTVIWPYAADTTELRTFLDSRFNVDNKVLDGIGITAASDSLSNHTSLLNALNSQSLTYFCDKLESETSYAASAQLELSPVKAAIFGAIRSLRLTDGASISQYVLTGNGALDAFGGPALASKPYFNTNMPNLPLVATGRGWLSTEIASISTSGGSVLGQNNAGNSAIVGEVTTTYKTDFAANPDISFKYMNYVDTASGAREYFSNNLRARFGQSRLTEGDLIRGRDMANTISIRSYTTKLFRDLTGADFVLLQAGEDALQFFKANLIITIDLATGEVTIQMLTPLVTQLRSIVATMKIAFSIEG